MNQVETDDLTQPMDEGANGRPVCEQVQHNNPPRLGRINKRGKPNVPRDLGTLRQQVLGLLCGTSWLQGFVRLHRASMLLATAIYTGDSEAIVKCSCTSATIINPKTQIFYSTAASPAQPYHTSEQNSIDVVCI